jgi:hypothetical protein
MSLTQNVVVYRRFVSRTWAAVFFGLTTLALFGRGPEPWIRLMCRSVFVRPRTGTLDPAYVYECLRSAEGRNRGSGLCVGVPPFGRGPGTLDPAYVWECLGREAASVDLSIDYHLCRWCCPSRLSMVLSITSVDRAAYHLCRWCYLARLSMVPSSTSVDGAIDHLCQWCYLSRLSIELPITSVDGAI